MQKHTVTSFDSDIRFLNDKVIQMAINCEEQIEITSQVFISMDVSLVREIVKADEQINRFQLEIERASVQFLAKRQPSNSN